MCTHIVRKKEEKSVSANSYTPTSMHSHSDNNKNIPASNYTPTNVYTRCTRSPISFYKTMNKEWDNGKWSDCRMAGCTDERFDRLSVSQLKCSVAFSDGALFWEIVSTLCDKEHHSVFCVFLLELLVCLLIFWCVCAFFVCYCFEYFFIFFFYL